MGTQQILGSYERPLREQTPTSTAFGGCQPAHAVPHCSSPLREIVRQEEEEEKVKQFSSSMLSLQSSKCAAPKISNIPKETTRWKVAEKKKKSHQAEWNERGLCSDVYADKKN